MSIYATKEQWDRENWGNEPISITQQIFDKFKIRLGYDYIPKQEHLDCVEREVRCAVFSKFGFGFLFGAIIPLSIWFIYHLSIHLEWIR